MLKDKSNILPGVPTTTWTGAVLFRKRCISSFKFVPPVLTIHCTFKYFPISFTVDDICKANSLVGTNIKALIEFVFFLSVFINCNIGITKEPVLPVPFLARAIIFLPKRASGITSS